MADLQTIRAFIGSPKGKSYFTELYPDHPHRQEERYLTAIEDFEKHFSNRDAYIVTAPGRTELGGNHTDHQHGWVLSASVTLDMLAVVSPRSDNIINLVSHGFGTDRVDLTDLTVHPEEMNTSGALIRGISARMKELGYAIGGFDAWQISDVPKGSGLSSSAAFEILIANILSCLYNENSLDPRLIAKIGQYAENTYFGKPSGLEDQMASSVGGIVSINFGEPENPDVERIDVSFTDSAYELCIINAGGSHANLTDEYASIPREMGLISSFFGKKYLSEVDESLFLQSLGELRREVPDRAILRALHFFADTKNAKHEAQALKERNFDTFVRLVGDSGRSSFSCLQNCFPSNSADERSVALALALTDQFLAGRGACRVHGGGFAGTIMTVVPRSLCASYVEMIESVFGTGCCYLLSIRPRGGDTLPV